MLRSVPLAGLNLCLAVTQPSDFDVRWFLAAHPGSAALADPRRVAVLRPGQRPRPANPKNGALPERLLTTPIIGR